MYGRNEGKDRKGVSLTPWLLSSSPILLNPSRLNISPKPETTTSMMKGGGTLISDLFGS